MNPSSNHTQQPPQEELHSNGPNEQRSVGSLLMDGSESATDSLPNEVLLTVFRFLDENDWLIAEQVCLRWKAIVNLCFATKRKLELWPEFNEPGIVLQRMKRYGSSVKKLDLDFSEADTDDNINWINAIGNTFPNLLSMYLRGIQLRNDSLNVLPVKCCQITGIALFRCYVTDETIQIILKGFPALKQLKLLLNDAYQIGECFRELGSNIEHLSLARNEISRAGYLHILSRGTHLQTFKIEHEFRCDALSFRTFCKKTPLRRLTIRDLRWSQEVFGQISHLSFLKELRLEQCQAVDSDVLIGISLGCPHLTYVYLRLLPLVCDRGVKCFAKCKRLTKLHTSGIHKVTDESLFEVATAGVLETLKINGCAITHRGVAAILAQCPRLRCLHINFNTAVGDSTVDTAIQTVESRARRLCHQPVTKSHLFLWLRISGKVLNRYKDGISHPLLHLDICPFEIWPNN